MVQRTTTIFGNQTYNCQTKTIKGLEDNIKERL